MNKFKIANPFSAKRSREILEIAARYIGFIFFYYQAKLIWFFSSTKLGYTLYVLLLLFLYGSNGENSWYLCALIFIMYLLGVTFEFFLLLYFSPSRKVLYNLLGPEFIKEHLGNPGGGPLKSLVMPILALGLGNEITKQLQYMRNINIANTSYNGTKAIWKEQGYTPSMEEQLSLLREKQAVFLQSTPGINFEFLEKIVKGHLFPGKD